MALTQNPVTPAANGSVTDNLTFNTSNAAPGSYPFVIRGTSGSITHDTNVTLTVNAPLSVTLTASTPSSPGPVNETLTATPSNGTDTHYNYTFWWDCSSVCNSVQSCNIACGTLPTPAAGACTTPNSIGYKCDGVTDVTKQVIHTYSTTATPKVIVENGSQTALATASVTITSSPPEVKNLIVASKDYCGTRSVAVQWEYSDKDNHNETRFDVQVDNNSNFLSPNIDQTYSSVSYPSPTTQTQQLQLSTNIADNTCTPPCGKIGYNNTYHWQVRVWDASGANSGWRPGPDFTTAAHVYPVADGFIVSPSNPHAQEKVTFSAPPQPTGINPIYQWSWPASSSFVIASGSSATSQSTQGKFTSSGPNQTMTLKVTDASDSSLNCAATASVNVNVALPGWQETAP